MSWRAPYNATFAANRCALIFDVDIGISFASRMLSVLVDISEGYGRSVAVSQSVAYNADACIRIETL